MAKLVELPTTTSIDGSELSYIIQGGVDKQATLAQIVAYLLTQLPSGLTAEAILTTPLEDLIDTDDPTFATNNPELFALKDKTLVEILETSLGASGSSLTPEQIKEIQQDALSTPLEDLEVDLTGLGELEPEKSVIEHLNEGMLQPEPVQNVFSAIASPDHVLGAAVFGYRFVAPVGGDPGRIQIHAVSTNYEFLVSVKQYRASGVVLSDGSKQSIIHVGTTMQSNPETDGEEILSFDDLDEGEQAIVEILSIDGIGVLKFIFTGTGSTDVDGRIHNAVVKVGH